MNSVTLVNPIKMPAVSDSSVMSEKMRAKLQRNLETLDTKIDTWLKIASKHGVDVSEERKQLAGLEKDDATVRPHGSEELAMRRVYVCRSRLASSIVRKVTRNLHRDIDPENVEKASKEMKDFSSRLCYPWIRVAKREGVDIEEEFQVILQAILNDMHLISKANDFHKEVIFRRQLVTRQITTSRIVQKVFRHRIDKLADEIKSKDWFDDERNGIVEGIRMEAHHNLPSSTDVDKLILACKNIYDIYKMNLIMYDTMPELYHMLADREVFSRSIDERARRLLEKIGPESALRDSVERIREMAHSLLAREGFSEPLRKRVSDCFDKIEERVTPEISYGCGFGGKTVP